MPDTDQNTLLLYVEDDPLTRASVRRHFRRHGVNVLTAESGEKALELVEGGAAPALVLLDIGLPGMDGVETYRRLRALSPDLPAVVCTAHPSPALRQQLDDLGVPHCQLLIKPCPFGRLLATVRQTLGEQEH